MSELYEPFLIARYIAAVSSLFVPGLVIVSWLTSRESFRVRLGFGMTAVSSVIVSYLILTIIPLFLGIAKIEGLKQFYIAYLAISLLLTLFCVVKVIRQRRLGKNLGMEKLKQGVLANKALSLAIAFIVLFLAFTSVFYPRMNWDGYNFYLKDAVVMLESNTMPYFYPMDVYPIETAFGVTSLFGSVTCSYFLFVCGLVGASPDLFILVEVTNIYIGLLSLIFIIGTALLVRDFSNEVLGHRSGGNIAAILFLAMPFLLQYSSLTTLSVDVPFMMLVCALVYYCYRMARSPSGFYLVMAMGALFLMSITKVTGFFVGFVAVGIVLVTMLGRVGRVISALLVMTVLSLLLGYHSVYSSNEWVSAALSEPYNLAFVIFGIMVVGAYVIKTRTDGRIVLPRYPWVWVLVFFLVTAIVAYFARSIALGGTPFVHYLGVGLTAEQSWAAALTDSVGLFQPVLGRFPGVPQAYPLSIVIGYVVLAHLSIFLFLSFFEGLARKNEALRLNNLMLGCFFLLWLLVLGMRDLRHVMWVSPFLAVSYACGIAVLAKWIEGSARHTLGILITAALVLSVPFLVVANRYIYGHSGSKDWFLGHLMIFNSYSGWFAADNLAKVCLYALGCTVIMVLLAVISGKVMGKPARHSGVCRALPTIFVVTFAVLLCIPNAQAVTKYDSVGEREKFYYGVADSGILALMEQIGEKGYENGTVLTFYGWGVEYFTKLGFGYINLVDDRHLAGMKDILESDDHGEISKRLDSLGVRYALLPGERISKRVYLESMGEALQSDLILNFDDYFAVAETSPTTGNWVFYQRIG